MGDRSLTLLELHFHSDGDVQVGPRWLGRASESERRSGGGRSLPLGLVVAVALVVLAAGAAAARRTLERA